MTKQNKQGLFGVIALGVLAVGVAVFYANCSGFNAIPSNFSGQSANSNPPGSGSGGNNNGSADFSVLEFHKQGRRTAFYVDPSFTQVSAAKIHVDPNFNGQVTGNIYAQPLFVDGGGTNPDMLYIATESNHIVALNATSGAVVWDKTYGNPVSLNNLDCGNINPLGITGTPVIDKSSRTIFFDTMTTPDGGNTLKHMVYAASLDDGSVRGGWPVDVSASVSGFTSKIQNQRGALTLVGGNLFIPYGGHSGDCDNYNGWVVMIPTSSPAAAVGWKTGANKGGIWATSGVANDGTSVFVATGNTAGASTFGQGESIIRFSVPLTFSNNTTDFFAPTDWMTLDNADLDLGGAGVMLFDLPGATPSALALSLGKDGNARLLSRTNLGGVGEAPTTFKITNGELNSASTSYTTSSGTFVAFDDQTVDNVQPLVCPSGQSGEMMALHVSTASPPQLSVAWCANQNGNGSPITTSPDGTSQFIVWGIGAEGDGRLHGVDGITGKVIFGGGGSGDQMGTIQHFQTPIAAKGHIYVASNGRVYSFGP